MHSKAIPSRIDKQRDWNIFNFTYLIFFFKFPIAILTKFLYKVYCFHFICINFLRNLNSVSDWGIVHCTFLIFFFTIRITFSMKSTHVSIRYFHSNINSASVCLRTNHYYLFGRFLGSWGKFIQLECKMLHFSTTLALFAHFFDVAKIISRLYMQLNIFLFFILIKNVG